jgi:hypothetical protein
VFLMYLFIRDSVREDATNIGRNSTQSERAALEDRRNRLQMRINAFHRKGETIFGEDIHDLSVVENVERDDGLGRDYDDDDDDDEDDDENEKIGVGEWPENCQLSMPSSFKVGELGRLGFQEIVDQEVELRVGQANDCLQDLREALGHKMVLFRTSVRGATGQKGKTRAWADVGRVDKKLRKHARSYQRARKALMNLGVSEDILNRYQSIQKEDLKMSGDMVEENRVGQRNDKLAWFWKVGQGGGGEGSDSWLAECKCSKVLTIIRYN